MSQYLNSYNRDYIEQLAQDYENNPQNLDPSWRYFFDGIHFLAENTNTTSSLDAQDSTPLDSETLGFEIKVLNLIEAYRQQAYVIADVNPLDRTPKNHPLLQIERFGLSQSDLARTTRSAQFLGLKATSLNDVIQHLKNCYTKTLAVEFSHIEDPAVKDWVQKKMESGFLNQELDLPSQKRAHQKLTQAENFCKFLHKKFIGAKRFSLEGCDTLIPMLDYMVEFVAEQGGEEILMGMAHRGRLNVLANIFEKELRVIFAEFMGNVETPDDAGDGDVKYHMGYSRLAQTSQGKNIHLSLAPNPSHLEAVNTVVMGMARAKQKLKNDKTRSKIWTILMHGDAAFAGQGSVYEMLNMSGLVGYTVGGTIHIVTNNQVGFTTDPDDSRSTRNATDIAKMLQTPIFRVNADEPESALKAIQLACEFRAQFNKDVVIDLMGYRRFGHNEGDEPLFTQPQLYTKIAKHPTALTQYTQKLTAKLPSYQSEYENFVQTLEAKFEDQLSQAKNKKQSTKMSAFEKNWSDLNPVPQDDAIFESIRTNVAKETLVQIMSDLITVPSDFNLNSKIGRFNADRAEMRDGKKLLDWGMGEALAFGSLLVEGHDVRLSGQDCERGTFSHRHSVFNDTQNNSSYTPLNHLKNATGEYDVVNSLLSEYAVLGYEFGQSLANPQKLTLWEAQFGDFANGAQIMIDQFVTSSAAKWQRYSGLVMLLPHGYEGQGPEHSSARIERYLQACAEHNIQICNFTTPAQYFHALRRQIKRSYRLPLVVATPKSLLRHPQAVSHLDDFTKGQFQEIIDDTNETAKAKATRVILCTGKVYYEILKEREALGLQDIAVVRIEQLYPLHKDKLSHILKGYKKLKSVIWCQEEPENMGAWMFIKYNIENLLGKSVELHYAGRPAHASPANGYAHLHAIQQQKLIHKALKG